MYGNKYLILFHVLFIGNMKKHREHFSDIHVVYMSEMPQTNRLDLSRKCDQGVTKAVHR